MVPPLAAASSLHELEGMCDYCGEVCDSSQDELNAINCTFETCPSPVVYHQHCVETFLKSIRLDKQRKTGFQCPRGNGRGSQHDKPCPGRVSKSHPIHARNDNSKKRRKAKLPEPAPPPPPPPATGKKPLGLPKSDLKKGDKDKDKEKEKEKELDGKKVSGSNTAGNNSGSKLSNLLRSSTFPGPAGLGTDSPSISNSTRSSSGLRSLSVSATVRRDNGNSEEASRSSTGRSQRREVEEDDEIEAEAPRAPPSLADFGYTFTSGKKSAVGNAWTAGRNRLVETAPAENIDMMRTNQVDINHGTVMSIPGSACTLLALRMPLFQQQGKEQRPPSPSEFVPLPSRTEAPPPLPPPGPGSVTMADCLVRSSSTDNEVEARRSNRTKSKSEKRASQRSGSKGAEKPDVEEEGTASQGEADVGATGEIGSHPSLAPNLASHSSAIDKLSPAEATESQETWAVLRPWSTACVIALQEHKISVFSRQLQELGFSERQSVTAVRLHGGDLHSCLNWLLSGTPGPSPGLALSVLPLWTKPPIFAKQADMTVEFEEFVKQKTYTERGIGGLELQDVSAELSAIEAAIRAAEVHQEVVEAVIIASSGDMEVALQLLAGAEFPEQRRDKGDTESTSKDNWPLHKNSSTAIDTGAFISDIAHYNAVINIIDMSKSQNPGMEFVNSGTKLGTYSSPNIPPVVSEKSTKFVPSQVSQNLERGSTMTTQITSAFANNNRELSNSERKCLIGMIPGDDCRKSKPLDEPDDAFVLQLLSQLLV